MPVKKNKTYNAILSTNGFTDTTEPLFKDMKPVKK